MGAIFGSARRVPVRNPCRSQGLRFLLWPLFVVVCGALLGCPRLQLQERTLVVDGIKRTYQFYAPPSVMKGDALPLIVVLHGAGGTGNQIARATDFHELAETENFFVAYPDGLRRVWQYETDESPDDLAFIEAIMDDMTANFVVDESRIYVVGVSNGGMLTHLLACETSDRIAAAAMVISALPLAVAEACAPAPPMPVLIMSGTADPIIPFDARALEAGPANVVAVLPVDETIDFWVTLNGIANEPSVTMVPDVTDDGTVTDVFTYIDAGLTAEVAAYIIDAGGHTWPGLQRRLNERFFGKTAQDFDATEVIWDFFARHVR